jgi:hypothetical protein
MALDLGLGEVKGKIPVYKDALELGGEIIVCEEGLIIRIDDKNLKIPFRYISMCEKSHDLPLGKIGVELEVFDQLGEKYYFHIGMADHHFLFLKKLLSQKTS